MPGLRRPAGSLSWKKTRSVRRSLESVGARLPTWPVNFTSGKGVEAGHAGLAGLRQADASLGHFRHDDGRALRRLGQQLRIDARLVKLPLQGGQGPLGVLHGSSRPRVRLSGPVSSPADSRPWRRPGLSPDRCRPARVSPVGRPPPSSPSSVAAESSRIESSCFSLKGTSARALIQSA